jgi:hypothetical protein
MLNQMTNRKDVNFQLTGVKIRIAAGELTAHGGANVQLGTASVKLVAGEIEAKGEIRRKV